MKAEKFIDGIPVNPVLPKNFYWTDNAKRPNSPWWNVPYVSIETRDDEERSDPVWLKAWPSGVRFDTYCLDGGAWDRPTAWGKFATLEEAIQCAKDGPAWRKHLTDASRAILEGLSRGQAPLEILSKLKGKDLLQ